MFDFFLHLKSILHRIQLEVQCIAIYKIEVTMVTGRRGRGDSLIVNANSIADKTLNLWQ